MCLFDSSSETTQHILQCTRSLESIQPGGEGHASSIRVRLLHAAVRQKIMKLAHERPEYYNVQEYGRHLLMERLFQTNPELRSQCSPNVPYARENILRYQTYPVLLLGIPINDLDCIGTVLSFSASLIWLGLPR